MRDMSYVYALKTRPKYSENEHLEFCTKSLDGRIMRYWEKLIYTSGKELYETRSHGLACETHPDG